MYLDLLWILVHARQTLLLLSYLQRSLVCQGRRCTGFTAVFRDPRSIAGVSHLLHTKGLSICSRKNA